MAEQEKESNVVQLIQRMKSAGGDGTGDNGQDNNFDKLQKQQLDVLKSIDSKLKNIKIVGDKNEKSTSSIDNKTAKADKGGLTSDSSIFKLLGAGAKKFAGDSIKRVGTGAKNFAGNTLREIGTGATAVAKSGVDFFGGTGTADSLLGSAKKGIDKTKAGIAAVGEKKAEIKGGLADYLGLSKESKDDGGSSGNAVVVNTLDDQTTILTDIRDILRDQFGYEKQQDLLAADQGLVGGRDKNEPANDNKKEEKKEGKGLLGVLAGAAMLLFGGKSMFGKTIGKLTGALGGLGIGALTAGMLGLTGIMSKIPGLGFLKKTPAVVPGVGAKAGAINKTTGKDTTVDKNDTNVKQAQKDIKAKAKPNGNKLKSLGKGLAKIGGGALRVAGRAFLPLAAVMSVVDGVRGAMNADVLLGKEGEDVTGGERAAAGAAGVLSGLTFGLVDAGKTAKGLSNFFGLGKDKGNPELDKSYYGDMDGAGAPPVPMTSSAVGEKIPAASQKVDIAKESAATIPPIISAPNINNNQPIITTNNNSQYNLPTPAARPSQLHGGIYQQRMRA